MLRPILLSALLILLSALATASDLRLTGRLECAGEKSNPSLRYPCPAGSELVFRSEDGTLSRFSASDPRIAIFEDERVRNQRLRITAEKDENGRLALLLVHTLKDGRAYLPHYFCSVCNITAYAPGPCWCCQEPFEFRETAVEPGAEQGRKP